MTCRWTPPVGDTLVSAETIGSGDGVVDFSLAGAAIPRGAHRVDFELGGELILSERFELPPAEALYKTVLSGNFDGLRAETSFRHLTVPLTLRTVWRYAEDDLPGTGEEVVLIEPHGSTVFKLRPLPGKTLPPGDYALLLYVDDAFLAEYEYRIIEESD